MAAIFQEGGGKDRISRLRIGLVAVFWSCLLGQLHVGYAAPGVLAGRNDYLITKWETEEGLPDSSATAMVQTPDGYLWISTFNGLARFDGVEFRVFNRANTPQLPSDAIVNLHLDKKGRVWVSTDAGMACADHGTWKTYRASEGWSGNYARTFAEDAVGNLYVSSFDGKLYHFSQDRFVELPEPPGERKGYLALVDPSGQLWVAQSRFFGSLKNGSWEGSDPAQMFPGETFLGAGLSRDGGFWLLTDRKLRKFREKQWVRTVEYSAPEFGFWSLHEDSEGNVWIASYDRGLFRIDPRGRFDHLHGGNGLNHDAIRYVFEDQEASLWVGSSGGGLMKLVKRRFVNHRIQFDKPTTSYRAVSEISPGRLLVGTLETGAAILEGTNVTRLALRQDGLFGGYVTATLVDRRGRYWIGTLQDGISILHQDKREQLQPLLFERSGIYALFEDSQGRVWIGSGSELARYEVGELKHFGKDDGFEPARVNCIVQDSLGTIWLGSKSQGLLKYDGQKFHSVSLEPSRREDNIYSLLADADGTLWIGTMNRGLFRLQNGRAVRLGTEHGFPDGSIGSILDDRMGNLWLGCSRGVVRVSKSDFEPVASGQSVSLALQVFGRSDGLESTECPVGCQSAGLRDSQGHLWFATLKGFAEINPREFRPNSVPPPVRIQEVLLDGRSLNEASVMPGVGAGIPEKLRIPPGIRRIEIRFGALSYSAPEKVRLQFRLLGESQEWMDVGADRKIELFDLAPDDYTFRVRAANNDGVWNETGATLNFTVQTYFWRTWWFRAGVVLVWIGVGANVWRSSRSRLQAEVDLQKAREQFTRQLIAAQERERSKVAAELHDSVGQCLVLIRNHALLASNSKDPGDRGARLEYIAELSRSGMDEVRTISGNLHPYQLDKLGLTEAIRGMCRRVSESSSIQFKIVIEPINGLFEKSNELNIYRLLQEAINNVLRHSQASETRVTVAREDRCVRLAVTDNGCGMAEAPFSKHPAVPSGFGHQSMRERVRILGASMDIQTARGKGTTLSFRIPLSDHPLPTTRPESNHGHA